MNEQELLDRIKANPQQFSELFNIYYKSIFGYVFRRTGNFDDAFDITSETFLKAFSSINQFEYRGISIKVWLYRIATNETNLFFGGQKRRKSLQEKLAVKNNELFQHHVLQDKEQLELELHKNEYFMTVLKNLKALPVKYQEVLSLRYFEGKSYKEVAEILVMNEGTVKSLLSRGVNKLREKCNQIT